MNQKMELMINQGGQEASIESKGTTNATFKPVK